MPTPLSPRLRARRSAPTLGVALCAALAGACALPGAIAAGPGGELTVGVDDQPLTMINVLVPNEGVTVDELADTLVEGLSSATSAFDGYLGAAVHRSLDDSTVVVYAQWESRAAVDEAVRRIGAGEAPAHAAAFGMSSPVFHPYEVVAVVPARS